MKHEKIIVRPDKTKYIIYVSAYFDNYSDIESIKYNITVRTIPAGKRKEVSLVDSDHFHFRRLLNNERDNYRMNKYLEHVTPEELLEAKRELWLKLEPK